MRIIHCAWAAALLSALAAGSCAKDTTGNGGTGTTESYNDKIDSYLAERYLWNGEYGQMTRDLTIEYAADNDNFLTRTLLGMTSNTLDKRGIRAARDRIITTSTPTSPAKPGAARPRG